MKKIVAVVVFAGLIVPPAVDAGVLMEIVTRNAASEETERAQIEVQDGKVRMDNVGERAQRRMSMLFLGDEFVVLDHEEKSYIVMDEAMLEQMGSQIDAAMQQMQQQLAAMPPEQRAMVEQMMKSGMGGVMGAQGAAAPPPPRIESIGAGQWQSYACTKYVVFEGAEKTEELCAAALDDIEGAAEIMQAFRGMGAYMQKMFETLPAPLAAGFESNPVEFMDRIDGFPVRSLHFQNGSLYQETTLELLSEQSVPAERFRVPEDYRKNDPFAGR